PSDIDLTERLRQEITGRVPRSLNITTTEADEGTWVTIKIPGGTIKRDRSKFTPIEEAYYQASQHMNREDWPKAIEALQRVIAFGPEFKFLSALYTMLGMAHARARNPSAAVDAFREAIKIDESAEFAHLFLGTSLMLLHRYEEAIAPLQKALEQEPE